MQARPRDNLGNESCTHMYDVIHKINTMGEGTPCGENCQKLKSDCYLKTFVWFFKHNKKIKTKLYILQGHHFSLLKLVRLLSANPFYIHQVKVPLWQSDKSYCTRTVELGKLFFTLGGSLWKTSRNIFTGKRLSSVLLYFKFLTFVDGVHCIFLSLLKNKCHIFL